MRPRGRLGVVLVVAAIALAVATPARAESVFGVVTDAVTHAGLQDFEVCAYPALPTQAEGEAEKKCTAPEPEPETPGEYVLGGVPAGSYKVAFLPDAESKYVSEFYVDAATWDAAMVIHVPTGGPIDAALAEAAKPEEPKSEEHPAESPQPAAGVAPPPIASVPKPKPLHCRKGFRKKKVKGKLRCVKLPNRGRADRGA